MEKEGRERDEIECIEVLGGLGARKDESDQVQEERADVIELVYTREGSHKLEQDDIIGAMWRLS